MITPFLKVSRDALQIGVVTLERALQCDGLLRSNYSGYFCVLRSCTFNRRFREGKGQEILVVQLDKSIATKHHYISA